MRASRGSSRTSPNTPPVINRFGSRRVDNAGGFSGLAIWRLTTPAGECCLRCWPAETSAIRVAEIHAALQPASRASLSFIPVPIAARDGRTGSNAAAESGTNWLARR
ncbi:MAG: hypothetical protein R3C99_18065 [Pirellulaceae bacterium]